MSVLLDIGNSAPFKGCLPTTGTLEFDGDPGAISVPERAQSFAIYVRAQTFNFNNIVGVFGMTDPSMNMVYTPPMNTADFYALPERYQPSESTSTMLVPNSPRLKLMPGPYQYTVGSSVGQPTTTRLYLKLAPGPIASGTLPLNFYITNLSGACTAMPAV